MYSHGLLINIRLQGIVPSAHGSVIFHTSDDNSETSKTLSLKHESALQR